MSKRKRIIDQLRKLFPDKVWSYSGGQYHTWHCANFFVYGESVNYDEGSGTHTVIYRRSDTYALVPELGSRLEYCG